MMIVPGPLALALALVASDAAPPAPPVPATPAACPASAQAPEQEGDCGGRVRYRVRFADMKGLDWRGAFYHRVQVAKQQGAFTVWTTQRDSLDDLMKRAEHVVEPPKVTASGGDVRISTTGEPRSYVSSLKRTADDPAGRATRPAMAPQAGQVRAGTEVRIRGRKLDQGVLAEVAIDDTELTALHTVAVEDVAPGTSPKSDPTVVACRYQVPEVAQGKIEGEWLIPSQGLLVVSLGAHTIVEAGGRPVVRERLVLIDAEPAPPGPSCPPAGPVLPDPVPVAAAPAMLAPPVAANAPMPMLPPPSRTLPLARAADGSVHEPLPPLPDDQADRTSFEESAAPRPSSQARPGPQAPKALARAGRMPKSALDLTVLTAGRPAPRPNAEAPWNLTLAEAIRIGLSHAHAVRVIPPAVPGQPLTVAPPADEPAASPWRLKAGLMELTRSIEQQYWALSQQQVQLWSRETAVELGEQILKREEAELEVGRGTVADVAEAKQRLENFRLQLVTATSDVITTERQLRNILGLPPADNRRIVPATTPSTARVEPDWVACVAQMRRCQPDLAQSRSMLEEAEIRAALAQLASMPLPNFACLPLFQTPPVIAQQAQATLDRQRALFRQVVHQMTHSLARFFLEVDANYKQFKTAARLRAAAEERLAAQQADYEVGRITIDRYLEAVSEWANAVAQEAQFKTSYNTSIIALEEAKGTLLAYDNIAVAEGPQPAHAYVNAADQQRAHRRFPIPHDGPYHPQPVNGPAMVDPVPTQTPPNLGPPGAVPVLPAPVGPLGPRPTPSGPMIPAGEPNILSQGEPQGRALEPQVRPASATAGGVGADPAGPAPTDPASLPPPDSGDGALPPLPPPAQGPPDEPLPPLPGER